ncbi:sulfate transport system permease protein [Friedmanniella endophytica]|uniref:Sulfate transport system permease protein CysT n=1 Tax=Microlunatus kandeliicorticis TaxID=1759536 RepID=A0A7W3IP19_9ACTN|nr:sulfate ABC transporter permease subunit CysT [Microlunatus kandeliicorticis]MBA8792624.1 sulfate transport system permease protein [Microlunatus kandeliicorticis]
MAATTTTPVRPTRARAGRRPLPPGVLPLGAGSGLGLGLVTLYLSILVLLPLIAVVITSTEGGVAGFVDTLTNPAVSSAIVLTVLSALAATAVNVVAGTLVAWVLVRDRFVGRRLLSLVIDIPFALPTIVAGLVLIALYGIDSPIGITLAQTRAAIFVALLFVTLPFVVRAVQPVLEELDPDVEQAGASLGAGRLAIFVRLVLPNLVPAIAAGAALSFARSLGEYGSVTLISGSLPRRTEVASARMLSQIENDNLTGASVVAVVLLVIALIVIVGLNLVQRRAARRG